jgi:hypothetical protein
MYVMNIDERVHTGMQRVKGITGKTSVGWQTLHLLEVFDKNKA